MANNDDKGTTPEATICVRCEHIITSRPELCSANRRIDYVTGEQQCVHCFTKNDKGTCADYEERGDDEC